MMTRLPRLLLGLICLLIAIWLVAPTLIVVPMSFADKKSLVFPPTGFSTQWYRNFFTNPQWFDSLSADDQQSFADAWPLIKADAETLLTDKDSMTGRIEDAGLDAKELPGCSEENWKALADVIDVLIPASSEY